MSDKSFFSRPFWLSCGKIWIVEGGVRHPLPGKETGNVIKLTNEK